MLKAYYDGIKDKSMLFKEDGGETPVTEVMIFMTMATGINEINQRNLKDFTERCRSVQRAYGPALLSQDGRPVFLGDETIARYLGLRTNASPKSKQRFVNELYRHLSQPFRTGDENGKVQ